MSSERLKTIPTQRPDSRSNQWSHDHGRHGLSTLLQWYQIRNCPRPKRDGTGRSDTGEQAKHDQSAEIAGERTSNAEDQKDETADIVDDGAAIELRQGRNYERSEGVSQDVGRGHEGA